MNFVNITDSNDNNIYVLIRGGIGKQLLLSGVLNTFFQNNNKTFLIYDHLEIFANLYIKGYDYSEYNIINDTNKKSFVFEVYDYIDLLKKQTPISSIANYIINSSLEYVKPIINLSEEELEFGNKFKKQFNKPLLMIQPFGSTCTKYNYDPMKKSLRDYFVKEIIEKYQNDYIILQLHDSTQYHFDNTISLSNYSLRELFSIVSISDKFISCDSMLPHISAAFDKKTFVLWSITDEKIFGHPIHINYRENTLQDYFIPNIKNINKKIPPIINMYSEKVFDHIEEYINNE